MAIPDRLELLETFVRVADTGALSRAARSLNVSQPSVSRRIQSLEDACRAKLIHRTTHYLELTDEGRRLLPVARELLSKWEAGVSALADDEPSGLLQVAAPVGLGQSRLMDEAVAYLKRYPKVQMDWTLTDEPVDVVGGEADIWISIGGAVTDDRLVVKQLAKVDLLLVAAELKGNRLTRVAPNLKGAPLDVIAAYAPERGRPSRLRSFIDQLTKGFQKGLA